jgi:hypothetical protein
MSFHRLVRFVFTACLASILVHAQPVYFLFVRQLTVSTRDSLVVPLVDPAHIAHARDILMHGYAVAEQKGRLIPVAHAVAGKDGVNRDLLKLGLPEWSWHIDAFLGFGENTAASPDNTATGIENHHDWSDSTLSLGVEFPNYKIQKELGKVPLFIQVNMTEAVLDFYWTTPLAGLLYTLEMKGMNVNDWHPVEGHSWPITTNHFTLQTPVAGSFFRVRAEQP